MHRQIVRKRPLRRRLHRQLQQRLLSLKHLNLLLKKPTTMVQHLQRAALHLLKRLSVLSVSAKKPRKHRIAQRVAQQMIAANQASLLLPARLRAMMAPVRVHSQR